jgi:hypothetical protein
MTETAPAEIPQRVKLVNGHFAPEFPGECEPHTPHPADYGAHSEWADEMMKTHVQRQCKGCGLWAVWEPAPGGLAAPDQETA